MYDIEKFQLLLKNYSKIIVFSIVFLMTVIFSLYYSYVFDKNLLKVYFLDVGQGDSILIKAPRNNLLLIDTGANEKVISRIDNVLQVNKKQIEGVLLTHQDMDHDGGFQYIHKYFHVKSLYVSNNYTEKLDFINKYIVSQGDVIDLDGVILEIISPNYNDVGSSNHTSIVSILKYGNYRFIFMGDADKEIERKLVAQGYFDNSDQYIDVLKLGHHGSDTSSSESFLKKIKPEYCIFSVGEGNSYGLPSKSVLDLSEKYCKSIYRTDEDGSICVFTDGKTVKIKKSL